MNDSLNTPQWTIRHIPWLTYLTPVIMVFAAYWLFIGKRGSLIISIFALLIVFIIILFIEITTCTFDAYLKQATIVRQRIWRRKTDTFHFNDVHSVAVQKSRPNDDGTPTYRIAFFMGSGEIIPLTQQYETGKRKKDKLARKITDYLKTQHGYSVNLALDGIVRIQQPIHPFAQNCIITNIFRNDSPPITAFELALPNSTPGFLLLIPVALKSTFHIPGGLAGKIISKLYGAYFHAMDISMQEISTLENGSVFQGPEFGLSKRFAVVTNQSDWARTLLSGKRAQILERWQMENPSGEKTAIVEPHIFINNMKMKVVFRDNYYQPEKINTIIKFINQLI